MQNGSVSVFEFVLVCVYLCARARACVCVYIYTFIRKYVYGIWQYEVRRIKSYHLRGNILVKTLVMYKNMNKGKK